MAIVTPTWGWWAPGASTENGNSDGTDIQSNYNGFVFDVGGNTTTHGYGEMAMVDGDEDGNISAVQFPGTSQAPANGDRFRTPDGVDRQIYEIRWFMNSTINYTDPAGNPQSYVADKVVVYQLGNGDLIVRLRDDDRDNAPLDFFIENVTSIVLGEWNGVRYSATVVANFDEPPPNVCFTRGTLILTEHGEVAVERLSEGELIVTRDAGLQPIRWIGGRKLSAAALAGSPNLRPIRIRAGALGEGLPRTDLVVSPQHRVLVRSKIAQRMFCTDEVLVAAKQLVMVDGIDVAEDMAEVEYFHFLFDDHQVVISNGAETESLYTGPRALKSVGPAALKEIFSIFPELRDRDPSERPEGARMLLSGRQGRKLAQRHADNCKPLVM